MNISKKDKRDNQRKKGQFWTPEWVADAMVEYVKKDANLLFDPGMGKGAFFKALRKHDSNKQYYGIDNDEELMNNTLFDDENCHVELRDFIKNPPPDKFDAIVANPPYIRHHLIDKNTKELLKQLSYNIIGATIDGRAGLHIYFLVQALNLLNVNGRLAFIMPSDTCEGTFSKILWKWITNNYSLECVVTFSHDATPFPNVDTNAIIFFIKKELQHDKFVWARVNASGSEELFDFIKNGFLDNHYDDIEVKIRSIDEALVTGLSRPENNNMNNNKYCLGDFANVMRGIATGANEFFFLTRFLAADNNIPEKYLKFAIGRTRDVDTNIITQADIDALEKRGRPTLLLSIDDTEECLPAPIINYLKKGMEMGLPERSLIKQRKKWYYMEKRDIPPILFTYLGRRNSRFIKNEAGVLPLTGFLCIYPKYQDEYFANSLWEILNYPETIDNLALVGKTYGSGAIKVEPRNLEKLPIPHHLIIKYALEDYIN